MTQPAETTQTITTDRDMLERLVDAVTRGDHMLPAVYREARDHLTTVTAPAPQEPVIVPAPVAVQDIEPGSSDDDQAEALALRLGDAGLSAMPHALRRAIAEKLLPDVRKIQAAKLLDLAAGFRADARELGSSVTAATLVKAAEVCEAQAAELHPNP
jgi:hypothetical protein